MIAEIANPDVVNVFGLQGAYGIDRRESSAYLCLGWSFDIPSGREHSWKKPPAELLGHGRGNLTDGGIMWRFASSLDRGDSGYSKRREASERSPAVR